MLEQYEVQRIILQDLADYLYEGNKYLMCFIEEDSTKFPELIIKLLILDCIINTGLSVVFMGLQTIWISMWPQYAAEKDAAGHSLGVKTAVLMRRKIFKKTFLLADPYYREKILGTFNIIANEEIVGEIAKEIRLGIKFPE